MLQLLLMGVLCWRLWNRAVIQWLRRRISFVGTVLLLRFHKLKNKSFFKQMNNAKVLRRLCGNLLIALYVLTVTYFRMKKIDSGNCFEFWMESKIKPDHSWLKNYRQHQNKSITHSFHKIQHIRFNIFLILDYFFLLLYCNSDFAIFCKVVCQAEK